MKKIAFFVQQMLCGGVETSLLTLVEQLYKEKDDLEISIYVIKEKGELISSIPKKVLFKKIPIPKNLEKYLAIGGIKYTVREHIRDKNWGLALVSMIHYAFGTSHFAELNIDFKQIPVLGERFDIAVNYHIHSPFLVQYLAEKVEAEKKYAWIHNDFSTTQYKIRELQSYLECYDGFYGVSKQLIKEFVEIFPQYKSKTELFHNIIDEETIRKKSLDSAGAYENKEEGIVRILTVGRLEEQKGFDIAIDVCRNLLNRGHNIQWLVVGEGTQHSKLNKLIKEKKIQNKFILLGAKTNPYPFFRISDLYVQTSRHEGWGLSISEAKCFGLPIVCTNCAGISEQIHNGMTGYITEMCVEEIADKISNLVNSQELRDIFAKNLLLDKINKKVILSDTFLGGL